MGGCITTYLKNNSIIGVNMSGTALELSLGDEYGLRDRADFGKTFCVRFIPSVFETVEKIVGPKKNRKK